MQIIDGLTEGQEMVVRMQLATKAIKWYYDMVPQDVGYAVAKKMKKAKEKHSRRKIRARRELKPKKLWSLSLRNLESERGSLL